MAAGPLLLLLLLLGGVRGGPARDPRPGDGPAEGRCHLPPITGRCRASIPRWFFNSSSSSCESFVFGGCGGNGNNFATERDCRDSCGGDAGRALSHLNSTWTDPLAESRQFWTSIGLVLGALLAAWAALGFGVSAGLRLLRRNRNVPGSGAAPKGQRDDLERLMEET